MPNPISGTYKIPGDLGRRLDATDYAVAQLQRSMTREKPTPKATTGTIGSTLVYPGTPTISAAGGTGSCYWTDSGWASEPVGGVAPPVAWAAGGLMSVVEGGWYTFTMRGKFWWDTTADLWAVFSFGSDLAPIYSADQGFTPYLALGGTRRELQVCHQFGGPRLLPAGTEIPVSLQWNSNVLVQIAASQPRLEVARLG